MARKHKLAEMDMTELIDELRQTKHEALNLRFRNATGQLENTAEIPKVRRQIARINTLIRQREIAAAESEAS
jgi:large subunit ribosomal protein L29